MKPTICLAAEAPNVYTAARIYASMGLSVLPCLGKKPALKFWRKLQVEAAYPTTIDRWHVSDLLQNVGIICGRVSGNLVVMDLDGDAAISAFLDQFPDLQYTYAVTSGSGHGMHLYYRVRDLPPTTRVTGTKIGNVELRSDGAYVVAPPSIHPDSGRLYTVHYPMEIATVDTLRPVVDWIKSLIREKHGGEMPPPANHKIQHATAYGAVALRNEAEEVARALKGERNDRLYRAALKLGSLIADGKIDRASVERELLAAAATLSQQDGEATARRTISSGVETGMLSSRSAWKKDA